MGKLFGLSIDACIVFKPENRFYFTKFKSSFGCVLLSENGNIFFTDPRYASAAAVHAKDCRVVSVSGESLLDCIAEELVKIGAKKVGYEDNFLTVAEFSRIEKKLESNELIPIGNAIENVRLIKRSDEVGLITQAQRIAEKSLKKAVKKLKIGMTEREFSNVLLNECLKNGAEAMSFDTIIAFGENCAVPHHGVSDRKYEQNDVVLVDFGVKLGGYCSDMTRTFCFGSASDKFMDIYDTVLKAQEYALNNIKAGMTASQADALARHYIEKRGYGEYFCHSLGHGVGLEIHEQPRLSAKSDEVLLKGMIVTVEPGVYVDGVGGVRIEDMVVIQKDGVKNLTKFTKNINLS